MVFGAESAGAPGAAGPVLAYFSRPLPLVPQDSNGPPGESTLKGLSMSLSSKRRGYVFSGWLWHSQEALARTHRANWTLQLTS